MSAVSPVIHLLRDPWKKERGAILLFEISIVIKTNHV
jgi:hypothetical protein